MGREESADQLESLKQHSLSNHRVREIDITERVMTNIAAIQSGRLRGRRPVQRFSVPLIALIVVILTSASLYAASEWIEIRNRAGDVKIQSVILEQKSEIIPVDKNDVYKRTYRDRVLDMVKPGQLLAYYAREGSSNLNIQYLHDTSIFSTYKDFRELLVRTSAPVIKEPENLPEGLSFKFGSVMPLTPHEQDNRTSAEHARLLELFQKRVAAEPEQDLFVEEVNWSEANIADLEYENENNMYLRIRAMKNMIRYEISFTSEYTQEILSIGGIETIFASGTIKDAKRYEAIWYDEAQHTHYQVSASGKVDMTEEQFKLIVKSLV